MVVRLFCFEIRWGAERFQWRSSPKVVTNQTRNARKEAGEFFVVDFSDILLEDEKLDVHHGAIGIEVRDKILCSSTLVILPKAKMASFALFLLVDVVEVIIEPDDGA